MWLGGRISLGGLVAIVPSMLKPSPIARVRCADGSELAAFDFGGAGPALLLAHATGFHAFVLAELARCLGSFHCYAFDFRAHGESVAGPGWAGEWEIFGDDVLAVVDALGLEQPYAFGHSCGGTALMLAEESEPGTFRHLYCYEPIIEPMAEPLPPRYDIPIVVATLRRRERWASREEAARNYASKPPLCVLSPAVLQAYVEHGFADDGDGVRLCCSPADEARIYANARGHDAYGRLGSLACPIELACGSLTDDFGEELLEGVADRLRSLGGAARVTVMEGLDHFGPMSHPDVVAGSMMESFAAPPLPAR